MIDIHSHLLPNLDDGSQSLKESIEIVKLYKKNGYIGVIATPHHYNEKYLPLKSEIIESKKLLDKELRDRGIDFTIYLGNEVFLDEKTITSLKEEKIILMADSKYILIELPLHNNPNYAKDIIFQIQLMGYRPILAHVERYEITKSNFKFIEDLYKSGVPIQINLNSLKRESSTDYKLANKLIEKRMVQFVATDTHSAEIRNPEVKTELEYLRKKMGEHWFNEVVIENPYKLIENKSIKREIINNKTQHKKKESFLSKLFKGWRN
ncbi:CpsB/CapC family capsule biosynthesis tyrosine phosphatase [Lagierella sp.]|uniref:tyrosine-protein phosphatase n=1 Tax=Lagierella sp. TaxID=2849657 RepID=UPI0026176FD1|nr:CpsB/CapC family capsule biosynthesis tyrosine phosphatase [Lagierella sp.]